MTCFVYIYHLSNLYFPRVELKYTDIGTNVFINIYYMDCYICAHKLYM